MKSSFVTHNCIRDQEIFIFCRCVAFYSYKSKLYTMFTCILSIHVGLLICVCGKWCPHCPWTCTCHWCGCIETEKEVGLERRYRLAALFG